MQRSNDDIRIRTGQGSMTIGQAMMYVQQEFERVPTPKEPRDTSILLGILRALPHDSRRVMAHQVIRDFMNRPHLFQFETAKTMVREARMIAYVPYTEEPSDWICFGDLSRMEMGQQCQYGSRYVDGVIDGYPNLGFGLRFTGDPASYHSLKMHVDDVPTFLERYREHNDAKQKSFAR